MSDNTTTELLKSVIIAYGGTVDDLPDVLETTLLQRLIETATANGGTGGISQDYVDGQDATTLTNAKAYADGLVFGRKLASLIVRPRNGVTVKPHIDWKNSKLVFDNTDGVLISTTNKYYVVNNTAERYEVPFDNTIYNFLVGSQDGLKFISAEQFINAANWGKADQMYYFGYLHATTMGYDFNFEVIPDTKTLSVIGDSISTFAGYIPDNVPDSGIYYKGTNAGVTNVHKMWWQIVCDKLGFERNTINAYGGSRVTNTNSLGEATTGVSRATALDNGTDPDIIIAYIGVNDFNGGVTIGDYIGNGVIPDDTTEFATAYARMLYNIRKKYRMAKVYCMTLPACQFTLDEIDYPECNSAGTYQYEFNEVIRKIARAYNCGIIEGEACGITVYNGDLTVADYGAQGEGWFLHPNATGQAMLADAVIKALG